MRVSTAEQDPEIPTGDFVDENNISENHDITYDIGNYLQKPIDDLLKRNSILHPWVPPNDYAFPYSLHEKKGKPEKRYASHKHLYG